MIIILSPEDKDVTIADDLAAAADMIVRVEVNRDGAEFFQVVKPDTLCEVKVGGRFFFLNNMENFIRPLALRGTVGGSRALWGLSRWFKIHEENGGGYDEQQD